VHVPNLPHHTGSELLVLHSLRCIGFVSRPRVVTASGLPESEVDERLDDLVAAGLVTHEPGDFGGWGLSEAGRAADAERVAEELAMSGTRATISRAYGDFLVLNPELIDLCTAWLMSPDPKVLDLLTDFDQRADAVLADLYSALHRFKRYRVRLADALTRARAGQHDYVATGLESYHNVWFQLHEDLLATLGIPRH
jgi:hypothetical protein